MSAHLEKLMTSQQIPDEPQVVRDPTTGNLFHLYTGVALDADKFKSEVSAYVSRKDSMTGNVVQVHKLTDEKITYDLGAPSMKLSVLTDYIPWRLNLYPNTLAGQQALFLLRGCCRGSRELLHRVRIPFIPDDTMVGIDYRGEVRVWWNQFYHRNGFNAPLSTQVRLPQMVRAIKNIVLSRTISVVALEMETKMSSVEDLNGMEIVLREMSSTDSIEEIGKGVISKMEEIQLIKKEVGRRKLGIVRRNRFDTEILASNSSSFGQNVFLSPQEKEVKLEFTKKVVPKRNYRPGEELKQGEKIRMIKNDIQKLRENSGEKFLSQSKSVSNLTSIRSSLKGDTKIPKVKQMLDLEKIIGDDHSSRISRFLTPDKPLSIDSACGICTSVRTIREATERSDQPSSPLTNLPFIESSKRNNTSRTFEDSRFESPRTNFLSETNLDTPQIHSFKTGMSTTLDLS